MLWHVFNVEHPLNDTITGCCILFAHWLMLIACAMDMVDGQPPTHPHMHSRTHHALMHALPHVVPAVSDYQRCSGIDEEDIYEVWGGSLTYAPAHATSTPRHQRVLSHSTPFAPQISQNLPAEPVGRHRPARSLGRRGCRWCECSGAWHLPGACRC